MGIWGQSWSGKTLVRFCFRRMKFCLAFLQIVLSSICISFAAASSKEVSYLESYLVIGTSCVLEAFNPNDGSFDQEASDDCGKCFDRAGYDISQFRSCSEKYLTAMSSICATHLVNEDDTSFWNPILTCFTSLVQEWDEGGKVQAEVHQWLGEWDRKWEVLIEASCLVESKKAEGTFDNDHLKKCNSCWAQVDTASSEAAMGMITNCTDQFLPNMMDCPSVLDSKGEEEAMKCFHKHLFELDPMGEALAIAKMTDKQWEYKWEFVLGASCIAGSMADGQMDYGEGCGKCFEKADDSINGFISCTQTFLPTMTNCSELVTDLMDFHSMAVLQCFNNRLQALDSSGEAQKMMAEYMKDKDSWSGMLMTMAMKAWTAVVAWFM